MRNNILLIALLGTALLTGCDSGKSDSKASAKSTATAAAKTAAPVKTASAVDPAAAAKKMFADKCVVCHGASGKGDGPGAATLDPQPRSFIDASWQDGIKDEDLRSVIVRGGAATGKSLSMPSSPELKNKPKVVEELVKIIRAFKKADAAKGDAAKGDAKKADAAKGDAKKADAKK